MEDWTNANERQDSAHRAGLFCPASCTFAFTAEVVEAAACPSLLVLPIIVFDLTNSGNLSGFITLWLTPYAIGWLVVILLVYGVTTVVQSRKQISGSNVEDPLAEELLRNAFEGKNLIKVEVKEVGDTKQLDFNAVLTDGGDTEELAVVGSTENSTETGEQAS